MNPNGNNSKKSIGPTPMPIINDSKDDLSKPKRVYGPAMPPSSSIRSRSKSPPAETSRGKSSARDSWMTEQRFDHEYEPDPLNLKARTFIQRSSSNEETFQFDEKHTEEEKANISEQIQKYNEENRSKTLQEIYEEEIMGKKKVAAKKDQEDRIFDWERDMNSSVRRMSTKSAKDLVNSSSLNDRFGTTSKKYL